VFQFLIFLYWWLQAEETQKKGGMVTCVLVLVALCAVMLFVYVLKKILGFWWLVRTGIFLFKRTWVEAFTFRRTPPFMPQDYFQFMSSTVQLVLYFNKATSTSCNYATEHWPTAKRRSTVPYHEWKDTEIVWSLQQQLLVIQDQY
jgi:hypothetical protein